MFSFVNYNNLISGISQNLVGMDFHVSVKKNPSNFFPEFCVIGIDLQKIKITFVNVYFVTGERKIV